MVVFKGIKFKQKLLEQNSNWSTKIKKCLKALRLVYLLMLKMNSTVISVIGLPKVAKLNYHGNHISNFLIFIVLCGSVNHHKLF